MALLGFFSFGDYPSSNSEPMVNRAFNYIKSQKVNVADRSQLLLFLQAIVMSGKKPSELLADLHTLVGPHTFRRIDVSYDKSDRDSLAEKVMSASPDSLGGLAVESDDRRDGVRFDLSGGSWAVARMSGTEPLVRMYAETPDEHTLASVLADLRTTLGI